MSTTQIRLATPDDLPTLYELAGQAFVHDTFSRELLAEKLFEYRRSDEFTYATFIAHNDRQVVGFMQSVIRPAAGKAWIGLFAAAPGFRRCGIASALLEHARGTWPDGTSDVEALAIPGNYFLPGLDPRYTEALCFLERRGFERFHDCVNLVTDLSQPFDTTGEEKRLAGEGIELRRAAASDSRLLDEYFSEHFGADWRFEAELALNNDPPALHLALKGGKIIAFSAHSSQNREWGFFGPMGTAPAARGHGLGRVLLWYCLNDMRAAGHRTSVIPWVGPIAFYQQWAGSRVERVFWRYRLELKTR